MTTLEWDQFGARFYETGVDRGVLYLSDNSGVAWNGLTAIEEEFDETTTPVYIDGLKYADVQSIGDYSATLSAITYPDEFLEYDDLEDIGGGLYVGDQSPKTFGLSYRTLVGNDIDGTEHGYKLHIVYDLTATPETRSRQTMGSETSAMEFVWNISGIPQDAPGYRPTAHLIFDSRTYHRILLSDLEDILYGTSTTNPRLPTINELIETHLITITDHGDGTWSATGPDELITMLDATTFQITEVDATYLDANTYEISTTL